MLWFRIAQLVFWQSWVPVMVRPFQSGFRGGFSTDACLIHLTDCIEFELNKGSIVCMILLYLQKAFDTVDNTILHMKKFSFFYLFMKLEQASAIGNDIFIAPRPQARSYLCLLFLSMGPDLINKSFRFTAKSKSAFKNSFRFLYWFPRR
jgi:hypothetical protein